LLGHKSHDVRLGNGLTVIDGQRPIFVRVDSLICGNKLFAGHLGHGCKHALVLDAARLQLLLDHPLALRRKIGRGRSVLAAARRSNRSDKQILPNDSHSPES